MDFGPIHERAQTQRALITRDQLLGLQVTPRQIDRLLCTHQLQPIHRTVYRLAGSPSSWEQSAHAAVLASGPDAWLSHRAGLRWWGAERCDTSVVEVLTHEQRHVRSVRSHRTVDLPAADRRRHDGLAVTSIERSLIDAGRYLPPKLIGEALDHAVRDGLTTYERFERRVQELGRQGRNGIGTARAVLASRGYGDGFGFEKAMRGLLREAGLGEVLREFKVHVDGHRYRVDFADPGSMVGIECDSSEWHELPYQREYDLARQNRIQNAGLLLMRYTVERLRNERAEVMREIVDAVARRAGTSACAPPSPLVFPDAPPR